MRARDPQAIEDRSEVVGKGRERIGTWWYGTPAVAARIHAQHAKAREARPHVIPHPVVATDGVRKDHRRARPAGILDVQRDGGHRFDRRGFAFPSDSSTARASLKAWLPAGTPQ